MRYPRLLVGELDKLFVRSLSAPPAHWVRPRFSEGRGDDSRTLGLRGEDFGIRTDDFGAQLALLRAGAGMGACPVATAQRDPDLVRVLLRGAPVGARGLARYYVAAPNIP